MSWVVGFVESIIGVVVFDIVLDDVVDGYDNIIRVSCCFFEGVVEVVEIVVDFEVVFEGNKVVNNDDEDDDEFDNIQEVLKVQILF